MTETEIFLCNFGGPQEASQVEPFLYELFSDPAILRIPGGRWLRPWLARRISQTRAPKVMADYQAIGFSPINRFTQIQAKALEALLPPSCKIHVVNRYTSPRAQEVLATRAQPPSPNDCFLLGLYPHFSTTSTGSSFDELDREAQKQWGLKAMPAIRIHSWWEHKAYNQYLAKKIQSSLEIALDRKPKAMSVLFSAHGIPEAFVRKGDPYKDQIEAQARILETLVMDQLPKASYENLPLYWNVAYQSRVGPIAWVKPYTDKLIPQMGQERGGGLLIVPISFVSDHLETLFEIEHTYKTLALNSGFSFCDRTPLPNDDPGFANCLLEILKAHGLRA